VTTGAARLTGARKAAILTLLVGEEAASGFLKHLQQDEIEQIAREVASIGAVPPEVGAGVLEEFKRLSGADGALARGGADLAQKLVTRTLGPNAARPVLDRVTKAARASAGLASLAKADPRQLSTFIAAERPQTGALILAHLDARQAAQVLGLLPEGLRADILARIATLEGSAPDVLERVSAVIEERLRSLGPASNGGESRGGARTVAGVLNQMDKEASASLLQALESASPDLAASVKNLMFVFDDLQQLDDAALREIVQRAERKDLLVALKGATPALRARFLGNMSKRAGEMFQEELDMLGPVRLRDVEKAQREIVAVVRTLEEEGLVTVGASAGDEYVV